MKYAFIKHHQATFTVTRMCGMMEVSCSAFYDWLKRPESARSIEDRRLSEKVKKSHEKSRETYGARRIVKDLVTAPAPAGLCAQAEAKASFVL